jgi:hypothetical protein
MTEPVKRLNSLVEEDRANQAFLEFGRHLRQQNEPRPNTEHEFVSPFTLKGWDAEDAWINTSRITLPVEGLKPPRGLRIDVAEKIGPGCLGSEDYPSNAPVFSPTGNEDR